MDLRLARRLQNEKDKDLREKITNAVRDFARQGLGAVTQWAGEFDLALDTVNVRASLTKKDFESLEAGNPKRFVMPITATQVATMTTFITQMLFGTDQPHRVEGRSAKDDVAAEHMNLLLRWNAEQQPTFLQGYLWVQDAVTFNRGVFYNPWKPILRPAIEMVETEDEETIDESTGEPLKYWSPRAVNKEVGGYCAMELVSPYDWFCDPTVPLHKLQSGRYAGHKFRLAWVELERRAELEPSHPDYVMPAAVKALKDKRKSSTSSVSPMSPGVAGTGSSANGQVSMMSRTAFDRLQSESPLIADSSHKADKGTVNCLELWARIVPSEYDLHEGKHPVVWQFIVADDVVLAVNESTYAHGMYPYSVAEARPSGHFQFSPSWVIMLHGIQHHVDYLKNRHQEALQRTVGNVFIVDPTKVDIADFLDPDKEGKIIALKPDAAGSRISDCITQVAIKDLTERFQEEAQAFIQYAETVTGANTFMQGSSSEAAGSATEFAGAQQMAAGRMSAVARLISVQGILPQTRQFVANFQQFLDGEQLMRYTPDPLTSPTQLLGVDSLTLSSDTVAGEFNLIAHDGTLPGTDSKKVAAISRILEASAQLPQVFTPGPGNLDPRKLIFAAAKAAGINPDRFVYTSDSAAAAVGNMAAMQTGVPPQSAAAPGMGAPGPAPAVPAPPTLQDPAVPSAAPPQIRPAGLM